MRIGGQCCRRGDVAVITEVARSVLSADDVAVTGIGLEAGIAERRCRNRRTDFRKNRTSCTLTTFDAVSHDADLKQALKVLLEMAKEPRVLQDPAPQAVVAALGENAITLSLRAWTKTGDYGDVISHFNVEARDRLKSADIDIPTPQRMVRMLQES